MAILENGQYDANWPYIHMMPEQTVQAGIDLNAKVLFPFTGASTPSQHTTGTTLPSASPKSSRNERTANYTKDRRTNNSR